MQWLFQKELTNHSLPEIGEAGGRDHTTVIYACEKTKELIQTNLEIEEDYKNPEEHFQHNYEVFSSKRRHNSSTSTWQQLQTKTNFTNIK